MTPTEFVIWFKGFVAAANTFNITPKQWDNICEYLEKVKLNESTSIKYTLEGNSSVSLSNLGLAESTVTYGRPEDKITYTND